MVFLWREWGFLVVGWSKQSALRLLRTTYCWNRIVNSPTHSTHRRYPRPRDANVSSREKGRRMQRDQSGGKTIRATLGHVRRGLMHACTHAEMSRGRVSRRTDPARPGAGSPEPGQEAPSRAWAPEIASISALWMRTERTDAAGAPQSRARIRGRKTAPRAPRARGCEGCPSVPRISCFLSGFHARCQYNCAPARIPSAHSNPFSNCGHRDCSQNWNVIVLPPVLNPSSGLLLLYTERHLSWNWLSGCSSSSLTLQNHL